MIYLAYWFGALALVGACFAASYGFTRLVEKAVEIAHMQRREPTYTLFAPPPTGVGNRRPNF